MLEYFQLLDICFDDNLKELQTFYEEKSISKSNLIIGVGGIACSKNYMHIVQWAINNIYINESQNYLFDVACKNNNLEIAQWIYKNSNIYNHPNIWITFYDSCERGNINIIKWIIDIFEIKSEMLAYGFIYAFHNKKYEISEWIYNFMTYKLLLVNLLKKY